MDFKIETGIPVPPLLRSPGQPAKHPFRLMAVGDSFFVPTADKKETQKKQSRIAGAVSTFQKTARNGSRFTVRQVEGGIRVWRTA